MKKRQQGAVSVLLGAAFLTAMSSIGPGFLTQMATFSAQYMAPLALAIVCVIAMDLVAQLNIWSVIGASGLRGQEIASRVVPGLGLVLAALVSIGGLAFNIGNVGGVALGLNALLGLPEKLGCVLAGALAMGIFLSKGGQTLMGRVAQGMSAIIIGVILYVCIVTKPPVQQAVEAIVQPENVTHLFFPMITLLGGACGGYISFAGAHRLLDAGVSGVRPFRRSVLTGVSVSGLIRLLLFLAVLGVCTTPEIAAAICTAENPAGEVFRQAAGEVGYRLFGLALFAAGTTPIIGAAYTSVSFLKTLHPLIARHEKWFIAGFIGVATVIMLVVGKPAGVLVWVGMLNGLILPVALLIMLIASRKRSVVGTLYKHPIWLTVAGGVVVVLAAILGIWTVYTNLAGLLG